MRTALMGFIAAGLLVGTALAQTETPTTGTPTTGTTGGAGLGTGQTIGNAPANGASSRTDTSSSNEAVALQRGQAAQPAKGANSFTEGEARGRLESFGFSNVADLHKDQDGVWRGKAVKDGKPVQVWLDYKGNYGQG